MSEQQELVEVIDDLDFPIQCEHSEHVTRHADEPARYIVEVTACCRKGLRYPLCESGWRDLCTARIRCGACLTPRPDSVRIVDVL